MGDDQYCKIFVNGINKFIRSYSSWPTMSSMNVGDDRDSDDDAVGRSASKRPRTSTSVSEQTGSTTGWKHLVVPDDDEVMDGMSDEL